MVDTSESKNQIFAAVHENNFSLVEQLLNEKPALIESLDEGHMSLLHIAAVEGHADLAEFLVVRGAHINQKDIWGRSPLNVSVYVEPLAEHSAVVNTLIANGCDVNLSDYEGNTPLHMAAFGETAIVRTLLLSGADLNAKNNKDATPLHNAVLYQEDAIVRMLLQDDRINVLARNNAGDTALDIARRKGWNAIVRDLENHIKRH